MQMMEPTPKEWARWLNHKSNKELWIEEQERLEDEKLQDIVNDSVK